MPEKFRNKYIIKSARLEGYDYSQNGMYFVTICTKDWEHFFGEVKDGKMILNIAGKIASNNLDNIRTYFKTVSVDEFVVMPNHVHFVIEINDVEVQFIEPCDKGRFDKSNLYKNQIKNNPMLLRNVTVGKIIRHYKAKTTNEIRNQNEFWKFSWQRNYYNHIVRSYEALNRIREYTQNNPVMWERDRNSPAGEAGNEVENIWM